MLGSSVDTVYDNMKTTYVECVVGLVPHLKKIKHVFAHLVVYLHGKAITRRLKAKSTYSGDAV